MSERIVSPGGPTAHVQPAPSAAKYDVIYADPPWWYNQRADTDSFRGGAGRHYPLMRDAELLAMRPFVDSLAADDCALLMWTTGARDDFGIDLIRGWGFKPTTLFGVWVKCYEDGKIVTACGHYTSQSAELLRLAVRGSMASSVAERLLPQVHFGVPGAHSEKPNVFRKLIECEWPAARRIELFCRHAPAGWDAWGNQVGLLAGGPKVVTPWRDDGQGRLFG